jgi:hypothetical protein
VKLHELAKEYWEAVGVRMELKELSTEAYRAMAASNDHDIQVTNSGTEVEAPLYSNPFRLYPPFGDAALEPRERVPRTEVRSGSEGEMAVGRAGNEFPLDDIVRCPGNERGDSGDGCDFDHRHFTSWAIR